MHDCNMRLLWICYNLKTMEINNFDKNAVEFLHLAFCIRFPIAIFYGKRDIINIITVVYDIFLYFMFLM